MRKLGWIVLVAVAVMIAGCPKYTYKPYLPEEYRGDSRDPSPTQPGIFTGKKGEYVIYGN